MNRLCFLVCLALIAVGCVQITASEILEKMQEKYESIESYRAEVYQKDITEGKTAEVNYTI